MPNNQLKTAYRQLLRNRSYTIINIVGLAAGIAVCLLIFVFIRFETSFDDFHSQKDRIYRVVAEYVHTDGTYYGQAIPAPVATGLRRDFPQLEQVTGIHASRNVQVFVLGSDGQVQKKFKEATGVFSLEPAFFDIFDFPWLEGKAATALANPNSAVLTRETAEKYFGDWKTAVGRSINLDGHLLTVTGVLATIPANTDFQLKVITPYSLTGLQKSTDWASADESDACYFLLPPNMTATSFDKSLRAFFRKYRPAEDKDELTLGKLSDVHVYDKVKANYVDSGAQPEVIRALWLIGGFILLIACVNFINLSTANSANRSREVGVRKVLGGNTWQLRGQFMLETALIVFFAVVVAIGLARLALPVIAKIVALPLSGKMLTEPMVFLFLLGLAAAVTFVAGWYPSVLLSRFNPTEALRSKLAARIPKGISLRRSLVVLQFVIAQGLIIGMLVMIRQMDYFQHTSMGFDKEAILNAPFPTDSIALTKLDFLRNRLLQLPGVSRVSLNSRSPADPGISWTTATYNKAAKQTDWWIINKWGDSNYLKTYSIPLVAGTNFRGNDTTTEFLVTEEFVRKLGIANPADVINKPLDLWGALDGPIVGVMKDFHSMGFKDGLSPVMITKFKRAYSNAGIKLTGSDVPATLTAIGKLWNEVYPNFVFEYQFLDQRIATFYQQETELSELYKVFAAIAIILSCLGLYGLASFMAAQRIKEIGIRKVLGATVSNIMVLFSREFVILISIAYLIAAPLAGWYMYAWLQSFQYRAPMSWWIFAAGGMLSVIVALVTVWLRALRAATANPVRALKTE